MILENGQGWAFSAVIPPTAPMPYSIAFTLLKAG